jgi:hypothetical protein
MKYFQISLGGIYPREITLAFDVKKENFLVSGLPENELINYKFCIDNNYTSSKIITYNENADAECIAVIRNNNIKGILCIFYTDEITASIIMHETIHIVDYIFEELCMTAQEFSSGNEPYAYLCDYVVEQIVEYKDFYYGKIK